MSKMNLNQFQKDCEGLGVLMICAASARPCPEWHRSNYLGFLWYTSCDNFVHNLIRVRYYNKIIAWGTIIPFSMSIKDLPSHLRPCRTKPKSISAQKSQNVGTLYECTTRAWGLRGTSSPLISGTAGGRVAVGRQWRTHGSSLNLNLKHFFLMQEKWQCTYRSLLFQLKSHPLCLQWSSQVAGCCLMHNHDGTAASGLRAWTNRGLGTETEGGIKIKVMICWRWGIF